MQVMLVLMISGCAAATAVGYVSRYGEAAVGWLAVCNLVSKFCNKGLISVVLSYLAFFCYLALNSMSAYKLTTRTSQWMINEWPVEENGKTRITIERWIKAKGSNLLGYLLQEVRWRGERASCCIVYYWNLQ